MDSLLLDLLHLLHVNQLALLDGRDLLLMLVRRILLLALEQRHLAFSALILLSSDCILVIQRLLDGDLALIDTRHR